MLVEALAEGAGALIALVEAMSSEQWARVPRPGVWSAGKDAEHVADGAAYHVWIVRLSLGHKVTARPPIERTQLTAGRPRQAVLRLLRQRTDECLTLIAGLSDDQLELPVRPPRARSARLAQMIEDVLIGHYHAHRVAIEAKLRDV